MSEHLARYVMTMGELHRAGRYDPMVDGVLYWFAFNRSGCSPVKLEMPAPQTFSSRFSAAIILRASDRIRHLSYSRHAAAQLKSCSVCPCEPSHAPVTRLSAAWCRRKCDPGEMSFKSKDNQRYRPTDRFALLSC
jgi:hypothetical protein